jgi:hypothetical protein
MEQMDTDLVILSDRYRYRRATRANITISCGVDPQTSSAMNFVVQQRMMNHYNSVNLRFDCMLLTSNIGNLRAIKS